MTVILKKNNIQIYSRRLKHDNLTWIIATDGNIKLFNYMYFQFKDNI